MAFKLFNDNGFGYPEKYYQKAFSILLDNSKIKYKREQKVDLLYEGKSIGKYFIDFIIDEKIIIELKIRPKIGYVHIKQVTGYLRSTGIKLAILIYFTRDGVKYRRIVNL